MAAMAALAMAGAGVCAHAAPSDLFAQHDDFTPQTNQIGPPAPHKTLQWDSRKGRWGLNLDMAQPGDRDVQGRDARVGVTYRIAPGLHTGLGVALGSFRQGARACADLLASGASVAKEHVPTLRWKD